MQPTVALSSAGFDPSKLGFRGGNEGLQTAPDMDQPRPGVETVDRSRPAPAAARRASCRPCGFDAATTELATTDHTPYYPEPHPLHLRVTAERTTGRLLGAQIVGSWRAEVAKRIDVYATALFHGMTVDGISNLGLSYTPPLGSPWDPVQQAGQAWESEQVAAGAAA
jgi:Pyridine nucleotide-disulphide oxidoreductase, dimerisation domain